MSVADASDTKYAVIQVGGRRFCCTALPLMFTVVYIESCHVPDVLDRRDL